jgi:hypothetical protein
MRHVTRLEIDENLRMEFQIAEGRESGGLESTIEPNEENYSLCGHNTGRRMGLEGVTCQIHHPLNGTFFDR